VSLPPLPNTRDSVGPSELSVCIIAHIVPSVTKECSLLEAVADPCAQAAVRVDRIRFRPVVVGHTEDNRPVLRRSVSDLSLKQMAVVHAKVMKRVEPHASALIFAMSEVVPEIQRQPRRQVKLQARTHAPLVVVVVPLEQSLRVVSPAPIHWYSNELTAPGTRFPSKSRAVQAS
jgi:hypothetical protein